MTVIGDKVTIVGLRIRCFAHLKISCLINFSFFAVTVFFVTKVYLVTIF